MNKKHINKLLIVLVNLIFIFFSNSAFGALDKWGGDDRVKNPNSKYTTGSVLNAGNFTLTSVGSPGWATDEFAGLILQPNVNAEVYYLIKSNTANTINVYGSDIDGHDEECNRHISDDVTSGDTYAILDQWTVDKINARWWAFDPYGNSYIIKSLNNFGPIDARRGYTIDNIPFASALNSHPIYGGNGTDSGGTAANMMQIMDEVKRVGINTLGASIEPYRMVPGSSYTPLNNTKTPVRFMPFINQIRIHYLKLANTNSFSVNGGAMWDAFNPEFQSDIEYAILNKQGTGAASYEGYTLFGEAGVAMRDTWSTHYLTPYAKAKYNLAANPYLIGWDWDEEPKYLRSEDANEHLGYRIITSTASTYRKIKSREYLDNTTGMNYEKYNSIHELNSAWGTSYNSWTDFLNDTGLNGINNALNSEPYVRDYGPYQENNAIMKNDLDEIAAFFWQAYTKKIHDALDNLMGAPKLNLGPGYHGWAGHTGYDHGGIFSPIYYYTGSVDGPNTYVDVLAIGDPMHGAHTSANDILENFRPHMQRIYELVGRPFFHESCWITAEADSAITFSGTIDLISTNKLTDNKAHFDGDGVNYSSFPNGGTAPRMGVVINPYDTPQADRKYFLIKNGTATETTLTVEYELNAQIWSWDNSPELSISGSAGDSYVIIASDALPLIRRGAYSLYIPLSQEDRAIFYVNFIDKLINLQASNGDYIDIGYSDWEWFDFSFKNDSWNEFRNFGWMTIRGNL